MRQISKDKRTIIIVCGFEGCGKTTVISSLLKTNGVVAHHQLFEDKLSVTAAGLPQNAVTTKLLCPSINEVQRRLALTLQQIPTMKLLILEITLSKDTSSTTKLLNFLDNKHDSYLVYYALSPGELAPTTTTTLVPVTVDVTQSKTWQIAAHALLSYRASPETFSELSHFTTHHLPVLASEVVYKTLAECLPGVSTRTLWYVVKMMRYVVENTVTRLDSIGREYGNMLDLYTKNVGLMMAQQIDQVLDMFSGREREAELFIAFPQTTNNWQMFVCNSSASNTSPSRVHLGKLVRECSQHFYKQINVEDRVEKREGVCLQNALINVLGQPSHQVKAIEMEDFMFSSQTFKLLTEIINKIKLNIPVILCGPPGCGKSSLLRYIRHLYRLCNLPCRLLLHNPALQPALQLQQTLAACPGDGIIILVIQVSTRHMDQVWQSVQEMGTCSLDVKVVVEICDVQGTVVDPCCVTWVSADRGIVKGMLENLGIPEEVFSVISSVLDLHIVSYRNINVFCKVYAWMSQVFLDKIAKDLPRLKEFDRVKPACALLLALQTVFRVTVHDVISVVEKHYDIEDDYEKICECFTLANISGLLFYDVVDNEYDIDRLAATRHALLLLLVGIETNIPVILDSSSTPSSLLLHLLTNTTLPSPHTCQVEVLPSNTAPHEVVEMYRACVNQQIQAAKAGNFKHGVLICEDFEALPEESRIVIEELIKCKSPRNTTCDITLVILTRDNRTRLLLQSGCLVGSRAAETKKEEEVKKENEEEDMVVCTQISSSSEEVEKSAPITPTQNIAPFCKEYIISCWIDKMVGVDRNNHQKYETTYRLARHLTDEHGRSDLTSQLAAISSRYGDLLPYLALLTPDYVTRAALLVEMEGGHLIPRLVELRLQHLCKEVAWCRAYTYTTELKIHQSTVAGEHSKFGVDVRWMLRFCEMSGVFCRVKSANLLQFLKVSDEVVSSQKCTLDNFMSWTPGTIEPAIHAYHLLYVLEDCQQLTAHLLHLFQQVVLQISCLDTLCLMFKTIARRHGGAVLEQLFRDTLLSGSSQLISALVIVYQDEVSQIPEPATPPSLSVPPSLGEIAHLRQLVEDYSRTLVLFYEAGEGLDAIDEGLVEYFGKLDTARAYNTVTQLLSGTNSGHMRRFVLRYLLHQGGVACYKLLSSVLQLETDNTESSIDLNVVVSGYSELRDRATPICQFCNDTQFEMTSMDTLPLVYYELQSTHLHCNCLARRLPAHMTPIIRRLLSPDYRLQPHGRIAVYLTSQFWSSPLLRYFQDLQTLPDLNNIYWMGTFHDILTHIRDTVKPTETFAGVAKELTFFKCSNGHPYSINNCGDPLQQHRCPECKTVIGGIDHNPAMGNKKFDKNEKIMVETGYNLTDEKYRPGKVAVRDYLSILSTSVLWYLTHLTLSLRTLPSPLDISAISIRTAAAFSSISDLMDMSRDQTTMFLLHVVEQLAGYNSDTFTYRGAVPVRDTLESQDILVEKEKLGLKRAREQWERAFGEVVMGIAECGLDYQNLVQQDMKRRGHQMFTVLTDAKNSEELSVSDRTNQGFHSYWITRRKQRKLFVGPFPDPATRKFGELEEKLRLLDHLPFLLRLYSRLLHRYNYKLHTSALATHPPPGLAADIARWHRIWTELDPMWVRTELLFPVTATKQVQDILLSDVVPTTCGAGAVTLNMIRYLSALQNHLVPESVPVAAGPLGQWRILQLDTAQLAPFLCDDPAHLLQLLDTAQLAPFLCDDPAHVANLLHHLYLSPLSRLPTDRHSVLEGMRMRAVYTSRDVEGFVGFYKAVGEHRELSREDRGVVEKIEGGVSSVHLAVTGLIVCSEENPAAAGDYISALNFTQNIKVLLQQEHKLLALYRYTSMLCLNLHFNSNIPSNSTLFQLLSRFLTPELYGKECCFPVPEDPAPLLLLLTEYVFLQVVHCDPVQHLTGMGLREALEFHLEMFGEREAGVLEFIPEWVKVDDVGHVLAELLKQEGVQYELMRVQLEDVQHTI